MIAVAADLKHAWPDGIDWVVTVAYLALLIGIVIVGYVGMALDVRDYLRSLRRGLVVISQYRMELPDWIRKDRPRCIQALGLTLPCTAQDYATDSVRRIQFCSRQPRKGDIKHFRSAI